MTASVRTAQIELRETPLESTHNRPKLPRCEEPGPEGTCRVLTYRRKGAQCRPDRRCHVSELPADLVVDHVRSVGGRQAGGFDGVGRGA